MSSKKKSILADKISDLITSIPKSFGSDDDSDDTKAKVIDYDDEDQDLDDFKREFNSLKIRKQNVNLLEDYDKRYKGKKVSQKEIFNDDKSSEESDDDDDFDLSAEETGNEPTDSDNQEENASDGHSENNSDEISLKKSDNSDNEISLKQSDNSDDEISTKYSDNSNDDSSAKHSDNSDDGSENESDGYSKDDKKKAKLSNEDRYQSEFEKDLFDSVDRNNPLLRNRSTGIKTMNTVNIREEIEKGNCVREQLSMWENLLETRIKLQKCLISSNKMPQYDMYKSYESNSDFKAECTTVKNSLMVLLNNLLQLQTSLINNFPETKNIFTKSKKRKTNEEHELDDELMVEEKETKDDHMNEEIPSSSEDEMNDDKESSEEEDSEKLSSVKNEQPLRKKIKYSELENIIQKNHNAYAEYRNSVIQKWYERTRLGAGIISKKVGEPALRQIEYALLNKDKIIKKTQLKRSEYHIIGKTFDSLEDNIVREQIYDTEIFDDDDFYHQLLRDLIEYKSSDLVDPIQLSKQWIQLQNMRNKLKRKIDTRATKGRRLRYDVHQQIVNFMAPIVNNTWTDHAKDDLYNSLFGKIKPVNQQNRKEKEKDEVAEKEKLEKTNEKLEENNEVMLIK